MFFQLHIHYSSQKCSNNASESSSDSSVDENDLPQKKRGRTLLKPPITIPETQSAEKPQHLHLLQQHSASESTDGNRSGHLCHSYSSHIEYLSANDPEELISDNDNTTQHDDSCIVRHNSETSTTSNSVTITNVQLQKYPSTHPLQSETTDCEMEETYVDYQVTNVQGTGDQRQASCSTTDPSVDGAYSLVACSLKQ